LDKFGLKFPRHRDEQGNILQNEIKIWWDENKEKKPFGILINTGINSDEKENQEIKHQAG